MQLSGDEPNNDIINFSDTVLATYSYNNDMINRMIKHPSEIKLVRDRFTTPAVVEFSSPLKSGDNTINNTTTHCKIIAAMKLLDSTFKFITQARKFSNSKSILQLGIHIKNNSQILPKNLTDSNQRNNFPVTNIDSALKSNQF